MYQLTVLFSLPVVTVSLYLFLCFAFILHINMWWSRYFACPIFFTLVGKISANFFLHDGKLQKLISGCEILASSHGLNQAEIIPKLTKLQTS